MYCISILVYWLDDWENERYDFRYVRYGFVDLIHEKIASIKINDYYKTIFISTQKSIKHRRIFICFCSIFAWNGKINNQNNSLQDIRSSKCLFVRSAKTFDLFLAIKFICSFLFSIASRKISYFLIWILDNALLTNFSRSVHFYDRVKLTLNLYRKHHHHHHSSLN